MKAFKI